MLKTYKYRLKPDDSQKIQINKTFGCCRFVYNNILAYKKDKYENKKISLGKTSCNNYCNRILKQENPFLREVDKFALTNAIYDLDAAYQNFYTKRSNYPKFKSKNNPNKSYTTNFTNNNISVDFDNNTIKLPKLGLVKAKVHRKINGRIINATVSVTPTGKYYVAITIEEEIKPLKETNKVIGLDLGIKNLCITSDGEKIENIKVLQKYETIIKKLQRQIAKKRKGSKNYNKTKRKIALYYEKIKNTRNNYLHKVSNRIINENQVIITEDLDVKSMMQESHIAKDIADVSWRELTRQIAYKANWYGRTYIQVDTYYASSQTCHVCGYKNIKVKDLSVRNWRCPNCNIEHNRDKNAAINILYKGLGLI